MNFWLARRRYLHPSYGLSLIFLIANLAFHVNAGSLDTIGVTLLRRLDPTLQGSGVQVAHPEAAFQPGNFWQVSPAFTGQPTNLFTWISIMGTATNFPNTVGNESGHADNVGANLYGTTNGFYPSGGVAPQIAHVDNYDASYFYYNIVSVSVAIPARIVSQSFLFSTNSETVVNQRYDDYADQFGTLFICGIGNGDVPVSPAATCYNAIGVGVYGGASSAGPTVNGRSKPDITAPGGPPGPQTSYSTPNVAGSAVLLLQAANRGDGGADTNAAGDIRTIKALLLNGAIKPVDWTNGIGTPLDARYGAGIVNVFNSWRQLAGGEHSFIEQSVVNSDNPHPPGANTNNVPALTGWDANSISIGSSQDRINHYYFTLPGNDSYTLTTTLVWNRQNGKTTINDLNLFLYNTANSNLVACSTSMVDNVEHLFLPQLPPGRYDLQVVKRGFVGQASNTENYTLAFEMFNLSLNIAQTETNAFISWPVSPTGFRLRSTMVLNPPSSWTDVTAPVLVDTNTGQNIVSVLPLGTNQYFRLQRP